MTTEASTVVGGVDTHKHTHYAAALDQHGRLLGHQEFPATDRGYQRLLAWMRGHGQIVAIGVESTGSFGATLTRALTKAGERVVEVNRPNRQARRMDGKSDRLDAEQIARAVLGQTSTAIPKAKSGTVEVIRTLRVTRASAVKARTQAFNTLWGVMISAPSPLRDELVVLTKRTLVNHCRGCAPKPTTSWCCLLTPIGCSWPGSKPPYATWPAAGRTSTKRSRRSTGRSKHWSDSCTRAHRTPRRRRRTRRAVPCHSRRQRQSNPHRGSLRQALRRRTPASQQRTDRRSSPTQPRR